ncbi:Phospholipid ABC transporter ATP-binding protein MlaF [hydrothermal vent metagenome]|uniref:Phospholipid ABC transporter ATP-binding protein MlaF n=1 Tax=hydrothermal vent metagenome TaxID=652676 RepID=A0A3B1CB50_9ZZZZ
MADDTIIQVIDLHKAFGAKAVLTGANLTVTRGESMVVIGGSGSGKSVLIKHMIGLLKPDAGRVIVDGKEVGALDEKDLNDLRRKFGMLFQGAALFDSLTIGENVGFALKEHTNLPRRDREKIVTEKLDMVGLYNVENLKPAELSGGMKKRAGLARAIAMEPEIILYDEPTTGLDPVMCDQINELIISLQKKIGATTVTITHDMVSANKIADTIAMLLDGKFAAVGKPDEVFASKIPQVKEFCYIGKVLRETEAIYKRN